MNLDFDHIDGIDDADDESLLLLVMDRDSGTYIWTWVARETLAEAGYTTLSEYGMDY
ncbi:MULTISPECIES: hypothetical protein [unclassified Chelatococcus]|uniref:hypothetical protein n=1 Tax=unclassified Chelatococcus TaxID=2638111 RepID=UPI001BD0119D|nr:MULTISPECIES: hypothetical protein [unclassified Chelatococcus]MBS7696239.1 hypothetical protein [Chelatococcus sp. YT9]MBX3560133.1 hypothetical protein [Chelatococcus sp.]